MNRMFSDVRKPMFKAVSYETMDRSSMLYSMYLHKELTLQAVSESGENPFIIAFIYNDLYDVREYLLQLRDVEITNHSYNIIKHYLRRQDKAFVTDYFSTSCCHSRSILKVLKGEIYRICQYDVDDFDEYFFAGYVSIGDVLLPSFESVFSTFVARNPRIIDVLDVSSQRLRRAVLACISDAVDYLNETNLLGSFLEELDLDALSATQIVRIFSSKSLDRTRMADLLSKMKDTAKFFDVVQRGGLEIYLLSKDSAAKRISSSEAPASHATNYLYLMLFYEHDAFDDEMVRAYSKGHEDSESFKILLRVPGAGIDEGSLYGRIRGASVETNVLEAAELFARFRYLLSFHVPSLEDILDLPERFFSYALKSIGTPCARSLKIFNDNLLNERLKKHVSSSIDRDIFIKYLIARHKLFDIELDGHEHMMDDKYKLMYAQHNLRWASENIEELDKIGIPDRLYRSLSNSPFRDCLARAVNANCRGKEALKSRRGMDMGPAKRIK